MRVAPSPRTPRSRNSIRKTHRRDLFFIFFRGPRWGPEHEIPFGADTPFILIARCHVKEECLDEYMKAAEIADKAVMATEDGMLHHTFDQDPDDPLMFTWSEVYKNDAALLFHLTNPPLVKFVEQHGEMGDKFEVEVYGTLSVETKEAFSEPPVTLAPEQTPSAQFALTATTSLRWEPTLRLRARAQFAPPASPPLA